MKLLIVPIMLPGSIFFPPLQFVSDWPGWVWWCLLGK